MHRSLEWGGSFEPFSLAVPPRLTSQIASADAFLPRTAIGTIAPASPSRDDYAFDFHADCLRREPACFCRRDAGAYLRHAGYGQHSFLILLRRISAVAAYTQEGFYRETAILFHKMGPRDVFD